jgi:hypothetical protein
MGEGQVAPVHAEGAVVVKITDAYVLKAGPDAGKKLL